MLKILAIACIILCCIVIAIVLMVYFESRNYYKPSHKRKEGRRIY
ncbi:MAG: hypothetical protein ACK4E0_10335 [Chitinophagaceae bacterium]